MWYLMRATKFRSVVLTPSLFSGMLLVGEVGAKSFVLRNRAPRAKGASGATAYP